MHSWEELARRADAEDELAAFREEFAIPAGEGGAAPIVYLCGNSLGLAPTAAREYVLEELDGWERFAVAGHFEGKRPWYSYHEAFRDSGATLVGARPGEVVMMNSLTVNLHLCLSTFYRPTAERHEILVESPSFPSDRYAVESRIRLSGFDPATSLVEVAPAPGEHTLRVEAFEEALTREGRRIALVLVSGVNFLTGQFFDVARITALARRQGAVVGWDLAHAAGNVPLALHDWDVDFAVWCSYKYLNAGPGAIGGCFIHERHGNDTSLPRMAGWWGNDPGTRFDMHLERTFVPRRGADGWQLSNPPIFAMAPLVASLEIFDRAGMDRLRAKSVRLTGFLEEMLAAIPRGGFRVITPADPRARGCQLSLVLERPAADVNRAFAQAGVVCDFRKPNVWRVAPVPLYNSFLDVVRFAEALARALGTRLPDPVITR